MFKRTHARSDWSTKRLLELEEMLLAHGKIMFKALLLTWMINAAANGAVNVVSKVSGNDPKRC